MKERIEAAVLGCVVGHGGYQSGHLHPALGALTVALLTLALVAVEAFWRWRDRRVVRR